MSGLRETILSLEDLGRETVVLEEWGGEEFTVRGLSAGEAERFGADITNGKSSDTMARLVCLVLIDPETGERIFEDADVDALSAKNASALRKLFDAAQRASGLEEDLEGN